MKHATPKDWSTTTLGDIAEIVMGTSPPGEDIAESEGGLPFIQGNAEFGVRHPKPALWCRSPLRTAVAGDLLVSVRAPVGEMNEADQTLCIGRGLAAVRVGNGAKAFVWHALGREIRQLQRVAQGSTFTAVNREDIEEIVLPLPPPAEQAKIAAVLGAVDEAVERSRAVLAHTKTLRQALLHTLLTRGLPGRHTKFKTVRPHGRIPESWTACRIRDLKPFVTSGSRGWAEFYADTGSIFLRIGNLTREHVNLDLAKIQRVQPPDTTEGRRTRTQAGDVLISVTADLGIIGLVPSEFGEAYVNQHIALVRFTDQRRNVNPAWVANYLAGVEGQTQFKRLNDRGTKAGLNLPNILNLHVLLPAKAEQDEAMRILAAEDARLAAAEVHLAQLERVKSALSAALLSGEIRVTKGGTNAT